MSHASPSPARALLLSICTAAWGFAVAVSTYPLWLTKAPAGQLPGYMTAEGLNAHASFRFFVTLVVLPIAAAILLRPFVRMLTAAGSKSWAQAGAAASLLFSLVYVTVTRDLLWTALPAAIGFFASVALRHLAAEFNRRDVIVFVSALPVYLALADVTTLPVERILPIAAAIVIAVRLGLVLVRRQDALAPAYCFAFSPLGLAMQTHFHGRNERYAGWPALVIALVTPFLLRLFVSNAATVRRRLRVAVVLLIYPLAAFSYADAVSLATAEGKPRVDFFEDAQHITPSDQYLRGEVPYRDFIPLHGFISDALLDRVIVELTQPTIGSILKNRALITTLIAPALYFVTFGATGAAEAAILALFAAVALGFVNGAPRFTAAVIALAITTAAVRLRSRRLLAVAGAAAVFAGFVSLDVGFCAIVTVAVAALCSGTGRRERLQGALWCAGGGAIAGLVMAAAMAFGGFLIDFVRVTLTEVATLGPIYALMPFESSPPPGLLRYFPEVLSGILDPAVMVYFAWVAAMLAVAVVASGGITARGRRRAQIEATMIIAVWIVVTGISYAERQHIYYHFAVPALAASTAVILLRAKSKASRATGASIAIALFLVSNFLTHAAISTYLRRARGPIDATVREVGLPRAQGALFKNDDITELDTVYRYSRAHLRPDETFFDFTNRGLLYFLLDRDNPMRQIEVAWYEPEARQREVIRRIEANPRIRFAVVPGPDWGAVDNIPNWTRAPLVGEYLKAHFEPDVEEGKVMIWKRK